MSEIDVTKVTAIEYLRKFVKIKKKENCSEDVNCCDCKYENVSCLNKIDYTNLDIKDHIKRVMGFKLTKPKIDWSKVEKDTLIEVSEGGGRWYRRYFAGYENGKVLTFFGGCTSKTSNSINPWKCARMVEDDDD